MRIALIPVKALGLLVRHRCLLLIAAVAALFILPFALSRDPEICVLNAIGLAYVLFQFRRFALGWAVGKAAGAAQRRAAERAQKNDARKGDRDDDGNGN
ncbi:MAG: hypothetical protein F4X20_04785 [Dehalococcoidia bacterium]|nr:hypothetical protein [Dehalococcoidia bacterium]